MQWLPWQDASVMAGSTAVVGRSVFVRLPGRLRGVAAWSREITLMLLLYALWQLAGTLSLTRAAGAVRRGADIAAAERWMHLPSEASLQRVFIGDHGLVRAMNVYYVGLHVAVTGLFLVWLFARHRDCYPVVRTTLALATALSLVVALLPVAPPRLVPGLGVVDAGRLIGPTVYPATAAPGLDQLSAMPSVHVAWAVMVAAGVVYALRSAWRWLAVLYPLCTFGVVVVTGNHFWADGLVAVVVCAFSAIVVRAANMVRRPSQRFNSCAPAA
jgi:hypothetical protein